jgi:dTDP-D-glucose 4,6-dehydratase
MTIYVGDQWRPFLHVSDAAEAIVQILETPLESVRNQVFNVGSNQQNYTIKQIGEIIQKFVPNANIVYQNENLDPRNYWVNFNKIYRSLQFEPKWTVEQGVEQVIRAIRSGKISDYRDAKYSNVKFLTEEGIYRLSKYENGWAYELMDGTSSNTSLVVEPNE